MKVVILAGGLGTRLAEETDLRPKPMVEIGGKPILWHIMKQYSAYGFKEFFIALGYKGEMIKKYFVDYQALSCSISVSTKSGQTQVLNGEAEDWQVNLIDTGYETMTGGRLQRLQPWLKDETFMLTYGDGVSNIDLKAVSAFHKKQGRTATVSAVRPPARFGGLVFDGDRISKFTEKPQVGEGWINGGFMVFEPAVFRYLKGDQTILEAHVLEQLAEEGQLAAYKHPDFWQCMDTLRDKRQLESQWQAERAPWKVWS